VREPAGDLLGALLVVPEVGGGGLLVQVGQVAPHRVEVEHRLDAGERLVELLELVGRVDGCHVMEGYATGPGRRRHWFGSTAPGVAALLST
jgi:hypothetical protein